MSETYIQKRAPKKTKGQKEREEMFDRLKKNPRDPEARKYLKRKHINYIKLSLEDGGSVEVRIGN